MNENLIYIVAVDGPRTKIPVLEYATYSLGVWEWYCKKHDIDLIVCRETDPRFEYPIWNKEMIYQIGKGYEKIGIVDCDTMIKWNAPNIFDVIDSDKFYGVPDLCDVNWLLESIEARQQFFPEVKLDIFKYINAGVLFFGAKYLGIFEGLLNLYLNNRDRIDSISTGGKEQTLLNFTLQLNNVDVELLSPEWNLLSIHRKNMFINNWQLNGEYDLPQFKIPHFIKYGKIWHFTGFPIEHRVRIMKQTWDNIKENYR